MTTTLGDFYFWLGEDGELESMTEDAFMERIENTAEEDRAALERWLTLDGRVATYNGPDTVEKLEESNDR